MAGCCYFVSLFIPHAFTSYHQIGKREREIFESNFFLASLSTITNKPQPTISYLIFGESNIYMPSENSQNPKCYTIKKNLQLAKPHLHYSSRQIIAAAAQPHILIPESNRKHILIAFLCFFFKETKIPEFLLQQSIGSERKEES